MRIDLAGIAVVILAVGLGLGFVAAVAGIVTPIEGGGELLTLLAGGMVAIVAGYVARFGGPSETVRERHRENPATSAGVSQEEP